jgi:hypothetical protein
MHRLNLGSSRNRPLRPCFDVGETAFLQEVGEGAYSRRYF